VSVCWYLMIILIVLQFPMIIRFLVQRPFNNIFCETLGVNFINILSTNFSYEHHFSTYM
jgi:hypothetical protein